MAKRILQHLRDVFGSQATPAAKRQLFLDDDAFGAIELLPAAMIDWCMRQFAAIAAFSARHAAPDGIGWTDIYVRPPAPVRILDVGIPFSAATAAIEPHLPRFDDVVGGSWSDPQPIRGAQAFGPSPLAAIVLAADADGQSLAWITVILQRGGAEAAAVLGALGRLPSPEPLMLVDWASGRCARLADAGEVERYLRDADG